MCRLVTTLLFVLALAARADAQELTAALSAYGPFGIDDLDGGLPVSAELRFTMPMSDRLALEPFVTTGAPGGGRSAGREGFYGVQIRQRIARLTGQSAYAFATYGAAGYYSKVGLGPPLIGQFGVGLHKRMSDRLAFRPEIQLVTFHVVPIGARFVAGVSVDVWQ